MGPLIGPGERSSEWARPTAGRGGPGALVDGPAPYRIARRIARMTRPTSQGTTEEDPRSHADDESDRPEGRQNHEQGGEGKRPEDQSARQEPMQRPVALWNVDHRLT